MSQTLRDTFDAFDKDGSAELGYPEYVEAWRFLNRPGTDSDIKKTFDSVDIDASGFVEWTEFSFSLMGEKALNFGALADLELLNTILKDTAHLLTALKDDLADSSQTNEERAIRNAELRKRMAGMKKEMGGAIGNIMNKMLGMMGQDPKDLLTDEQIAQILTETFNKFDHDGSGQLEKTEFIKAWKFLGLEASKEEMNRSFAKVDADGSGIVELPEFKSAIMDSRAAELSLTVLMSKMDGQLEGLEGIFEEYKAKLDKSRKEAEERIKNSEASFKNFQATVRKRRLMKKQMGERIAEITRELVNKMGGEDQNTQELEMYKTLKDTFNAFDRDGNAELGFPEYKEAWKFLNQPGGDKDIKRAFDSVDIDGSALVEWDEFVFSIMGEAALKYGTLADMEKLTTLLDATMKDYALIQDTLGEVRANNDTRATRNNELRNRLENMKGDVQNTVNDLIAQLMGIDPRDVMSEVEIDHHLEAAFHKFDKDNSGELGQWEFKQAWIEGK